MMRTIAEVCFVAGMVSLTLGILSMGIHLFLYSLQDAKDYFREGKK